METKVIKFIIAAGAGAYFLYCLIHPGDWHFIDNVNLLIHEGGHMVFMPFGQFLYVLGGSLTQIVLPLVFVVYFYVTQRPYSAALTLFWAGESAVNVSVYASDALKMNLPLLFGDNSTHDWNWLLLYTGQLRHTAAIGEAVYLLGVVFTITAAAGAFYYSWNEPEIITIHND